MLTAMLVLANVAVFAFELNQGDNLETLVRRWGLVPADLAENPAALVTLLTSTFLHVGWLHLLSNLLFLALFGPPVERRLGSLKFGALYLASGLGGSIAHMLVQPLSVQPALGASGAVAGVIAAHLVLFPNATLGSLAPVLFLPVIENVPVLPLLLVWIAAQLLAGLTNLTSSTAVAWSAHLGGFVIGLTVALLLRGQRVRRT
ncbi:MAG TPA: rhomboid family intramembrane serine protease [Chloroflexota bacterium]|jgi:membrane associated rhomboid family serine protease|nr:rhomboid family intramembrane serine protease [Chloroflexota bacterium]